MERRSVLTDLIDGAVAGALATWAMGKVTTVLYEKERPAVREREDAARQGKTSFGVAAEKLAAAAGATLSDAQRASYGAAIHWAVGITGGALYGVLRPRVANADVARGLAFGTAFWLLMDEGATPLLRLTPGPGAFPWQTHARGLAGHLVFGAVADATLDLLQHAA